MHVPFVALSCSSIKSSSNFHSTFANIRLSCSRMYSETENAFAANHQLHKMWSLASWIFSWCFESFEDLIVPWCFLVWLYSKCPFDCRIMSLENSHWVTLLQLIDLPDFAFLSLGCIRCNFRHYQLLLDLLFSSCLAPAEMVLPLPILSYLVKLNVLIYKLSSIWFSSAEHCFVFPRFKIGWCRQQWSSPASSTSHHYWQPGLLESAFFLTQLHYNHFSWTFQILTSADPL